MNSLVCDVDVYFLPSRQTYHIWFEWRKQKRSTTNIILFYFDTHRPLSIRMFSFSDFILNDTAHTVFTTNEEESIPNIKSKTTYWCVKKVKKNTKFYLRLNFHVFIGFRTPEFYIWLVLLFLAWQIEWMGGTIKQLVHALCRQLKCA